MICCVLPRERGPLVRVVLIHSCKFGHGDPLDWCFQCFYPDRIRRVPERTAMEYILQKCLLLHTVLSFNKRTTSTTRICCKVPVSYNKHVVMSQVSMSVYRSSYRYVQLTILFNTDLPRNRRILKIHRQRSLKIRVILRGICSISRPVLPPSIHAHHGPLVLPMSIRKQSPLHALYERLYTLCKISKVYVFVSLGVLESMGPDLKAQQQRSAHSQA
jgi:hypothetical protein